MRAPRHGREATQADARGGAGSTRPAIRCLPCPAVPALYGLEPPGTGRVSLVVRVVAQDQVCGGCARACVVITSSSPSSSSTVRNGLLMARHGPLPFGVSTPP